MNDQEFLVLEDLLSQLCIQLGAPELIDDRFYIRPRSSDGIDGRLMPPRERVIAKMKALERFMSLFDVGVYQAAITEIRNLTIQPRKTSVERLNLLSGVDVVLPNREGIGEEAFPLEELPQLDELRQQLRTLIHQLLET